MNAINSIYPQDRARREAMTWTRTDERCQRCGGLVLMGTLDGEAIANACADCPTTLPATCAATELAREWRAQG